MRCCSISASTNLARRSSGTSDQLLLMMPSGARVWMIPYTLIILYDLAVWRNIGVKKPSSNIILLNFKMYSCFTYSASISFLKTYPQTYGLALTFIDLSTNSLRYLFEGQSLQTSALFCCNITSLYPSKIDMNLTMS